MAPARTDPAAANVLITVVASFASVLIALTSVHGWHGVADRPAAFLAFVGVTFVLQLVSVQVYDRGAFSFAGSGMLALGFAFGVGPAAAVSAGMGIVNLIRRRGKLNRGIFDASQWALGAAAGAGVYQVFDEHGSALTRLGPALGGGAAFLLVNIGLLTFAMSLSESTSPTVIFRERFRWIMPYHLVSGPLALALVVAYEKVGISGLLAFAFPPAFMMFSIRQYLEKTRKAAEEVQAANVTLSERNEDLHELFEFAGGLAARAHDAATLIGYVEEALSQLAGTNVRVTTDTDARGLPLESGGVRVGSLQFTGDGLDVERWQRLRDAILPQLATALESAELVDEVRKKHLATIAALSRSMEAKDYYTGGHTERVSDIAVAIGRRLGYEGAELDAIEIGALMHDIGKIGIPERILHKPGPLDAEEWNVIREHPVISDRILSEVDLHPIVRQIARSSHERIDGKGYPDGLAGDQVPLPARIALVADAFDALTSDRPYRSARNIATALEELRANAGTQFCVRCVAALEAVWREEPHVLGGLHLHAVGAA